MATQKRESVEVGAEFAGKIARIVEINAQVRDLEDEGKALKAEFVDAVGGPDMAVLFGNVTVAVDGEAIANVSGRVRDNIKVTDLRDAVAAVVAAMGAAGLSESHAEIMQMVQDIPALITQSEYAVVTPKR